MKRRHFTVSTAFASIGASFATAAEARHVATQVYPWITFYRRGEKQWDDQTGVPAVASTGLAGFEPIGKNPAHIRSLGPLIKESGLEMRSIYVNSTLHDSETADESIKEVLEIATAARSLGTKIVVTNPSPMKWGSEESKSDEELREQAKNLELLGRRLADQGQQLAYHNHDVELRHGAREFHHMLTATDPDFVKFCLDAHWVFRGCGNSEVAVFDAVTNYHQRIVELHLRQSVDGIWTEAFSMTGDIDYDRLFKDLAARGIEPHLVLEQSIEKATAVTMGAVAAHREGRQALLSGL